MPPTCTQFDQQDIGLHLLVGFQGLTADQELKSLIDHFHIGGIVLFRRNIESPEQLAELLRKAQEHARRVLRRPLWVAIDQEGGPVQRLKAPFTKLPSARDAVRGGAESVAHWAAVAARELAGVGISINLAPVLDIPPDDPAHFMTERTLGIDPHTVARLGRVWVETLQAHGVSATAKHFPGLGQAEEDPHHYAPVIRWLDTAAVERDLMPFREAIAAGVHAVMTSHALYPFLDRQWPATLSSVINDEWLRRRLGFEGILLSDDLDMAAVAERFTWAEVARQGLLASVDCFLLCQRSENIEPFYRALADVLKRNADLRERHEASLGRLRRFGMKLV